MSLKDLTHEELLEAVAQMLYDKAELAQRAEDDAITDEIRAMYGQKYRTYCGAAEYVRMMKEDL